jgi:hypothetical protein
MSRTVGIGGMKTRFIPPGENSHMSTSIGRSAQAHASPRAAGQDAFTAEGGHVDTRSHLLAEAGVAHQEEQARLMATLGIHHKGRYYHFRGYR